jgi:hypothetical protein
MKSAATLFLAIMGAVSAFAPPTVLSPGQRAVVLAAKRQRWDNDPPTTVGLARFFSLVAVASIVSWNVPPIASAMPAADRQGPTGTSSLARDICRVLFVWNRPNFHSHTHMYES